MANSTANSGDTQCHTVHRRDMGEKNENKKKVSGEKRETGKTWWGKNTKFMVDVVVLAASAAGAVLLGVLALLMWMKTSVVR